MQQLARKKQTRRTALKSDLRTLARQANLTEFINSPLHNPEFPPSMGVRTVRYTFSGTQAQFGGLIFLSDALSDADSNTSTHFGHYP